MNDAIADSFNSRVKPNDTIYHLGDWSFGGHNKIFEFWDRLVCKNIILIYGNHDYNIRNKKQYRDLFTKTYDMLTKKINGKTFVLCHYALRVFEGSHKGYLHCYGHSHHTLPEVGRSMDVGWCKWRRPLDFDEVIAELESRPVLLVDHHNPSTNI